MKKLLILLVFVSQLAFCQTNTDGFVIYKVSLTEGYGYYDEEYIRDYPDIYAESLKTDSLINGIELGVVFKNHKSNSFRLKEYQVGANKEFSALNKVSGQADYYYNAQTKTSNILVKYWLQDLNIEIKTTDNWDIDLSKTKIIDGYKCYYAQYKPSGLWWEFSEKEDANAWFTTQIPLSYGPLHYNGLPGLIIELNVENVRYTAEKIGFTKTYDNRIKPLKTTIKPITGAEFIKNRFDYRQQAKRISIGN